MRNRAILLAMAVVCLVPAVWAETIVLTTGEELQAKVVSHEETGWVVEHPLLGELRLPSDQVVEIRPDQPPVRWQRRFELGLSGSQGNSETMDLRLALTGEKSAPEYRWKFDAAWWQTSSDGETDQEEANAGIRREWLEPGSPWFLFAQGRGNHDRFQDWDTRFSASGGFGYTHIDTPDLRLATRYGLGAYREFGGSDHSINPEAVIGLEAGWEVLAQKMSAEVDLYPDLGDAGEYQLIARADWIVGLQGLAGIDLKIGVEDEYQSHTEEDAKHNDFRYFASLTYTF